VRQQVLDEMLVSGLRDWVQASEVASLSMEVGGASTDSEIRTLSLTVIRDALEQGLMTVGDLTREGFTPWGGEGEAAIHRVEASWLDLGRGPNLGEVCWLCNTDAGDIRANQVLAGRREEPPTQA
jgi:hypothetical protein